MPELCGRALGHGARRLTPDGAGGYRGVCVERERCGGVHADRRSIVDLFGVVGSGYEWPLAGAGTVEVKVQVDVDIEVDGLDRCLEGR